MTYILLGVIIFLLFVWDICLFAHDRRVNKKLDEILERLPRFRVGYQKKS